MMNYWKILEDILRRRGFRSYEIIGLLKEILRVANSLNKTRGEVAIKHKLNTIKKKIAFIEEEFDSEKVYRWGTRLEDMSENERAKYE